MQWTVEIDAPEISEEEKVIELILLWLFFLHLQ